MVAAEKMRKLIASSNLRLNEEDLKFTVSIGATIINESDTPESIITRADQLMYISKKNGKNIVTLG
jgi:diguanylate cyclase (GGDEF)-like protein